MTTLALAAVVVALWAGFKWADGFGGNLLAEFVGVVGSALVTALVIDQLIQARRRRRWSRVESATRQELASELSQIAFGIELDGRVHFTSAFAQGLAVDPHASRLAGLKEAQAQLRARLAVTQSAEKSPQPEVDLEQLDGDSKSDNPFWLLPGVPFDNSLRRIEDSLFPRVVEWADDPGLVELLLLVERRASMLGLYVGGVSEADAEMGISFPWLLAVKLHEAITNTYEYLLNASE